MIVRIGTRNLASGSTWHEKESVRKEPRRHESERRASSVVWGVANGGLSPLQ